MKLLLDEDSAGVELAAILRKVGHDVETVRELGRAGDADPLVLMYAIKESRILVSRNSDDFEELHDLIMAAGGHHPGILIERKDNDPRRDMSVRGVAVAVGKLETSKMEVADTFQFLNAWR